MYKFARPATDAEVECINNRELTRVTNSDMLFFVMGDDFGEKFGVDKNAGEVAVYSPNFEKDLSCAWIGQREDFDIMTY